MPRRKTDEVIARDMKILELNALGVHYKEIAAQLKATRIPHWDLHKERVRQIIKGHQSHLAAFNRFMGMA